MARKDRRSAAVERLEGLMDAGDWRSARVEAVRLEASDDPAEREVAAATARRLRPGPTAVLAFVVGLAFLAAVAVVGLWPR